MTTAAAPLIESSRAVDVMEQIEEVMKDAGYKLTGSLDGGVGTGKSQGGQFGMAPISMDPRSGGQSRGRENILFVLEISLATARGQGSGVKAVKTMIRRLQGITALLLNDVRIESAPHREFRGTRFDNEPNKTVARLQIGFLIQEKYR